MCKKYLILYLGLLISSFGFGQRMHQSQDVSQNFIQVEPKLYACKYETTNADYKAFFNDISIRRPGLRYNLVLDTAKWKNKENENKALQEKYYASPKYAAYPVVNISYEQANFYCNWLTQMYHLDPNRPFKKVVFRLPKRQEWVNMVFGSNPADTFVWGPDETARPKGLKIANGITKAPYLKPVNAKKYIQGKTPLYHALGNVSEMVSNQGDCIGGHFASNPYFFRRDAVNEFFPGYVPCPLVGFRVFMQVLEE